MCVPARIIETRGFVITLFHDRSATTKKEIIFLYLSLEAVGFIHVVIVVFSHPKGLSIIEKTVIT